MKYFAYQIYDNQDGAGIWVDTDSVKLWEMFVDDIKLANQYCNGVEEIEVGFVEADDSNEAINKIRAGEWNPSSCKMRLGALS